MGGGADDRQGNFLSWHRYFTWAYEQTLRNEVSIFVSAQCNHN
jgi:hypothetical protein